MPGSQVGWLGEGVHVMLPVGKTSKVSLTANWPHPSFIGNFLPAWPEITDQGFNAHWQTSFFSTNLQEALNSCVSRSSCEGFFARSFGVSFIDPVDQ